LPTACGTVTRIAYYLLNVTRIAHHLLNVTRIAYYLLNVTRIAYYLLNVTRSVYHLLHGQRYNLCYTMKLLTNVTVSAYTKQYTINETQQ
jgi:hypothetical protein